ncbi:MAG: thermonuclease family protein, partial [Alphaproteobacteria bacterium]|nr:thermonuclease family protein [Alphaproteobacteria bacterium]
RSDMRKMKSGKIYRLAQLRVPAEYVFDAMEFMEKTLVGKTVGIYTYTEQNEPPRDRFGNIYAHIVKEDGSWVQGDLVGRGISWAYSTPENRIMTRVLRDYASIAAATRTGFWKKSEYAFKSKDDIRGYVNSYQVVEGTITWAFNDPEDGSSIFYIGQHGTREANFLFYIKNRWLNKFFRKKNAAFAARDWTYAHVRVHGWVHKLDTVPAIEVTHPEQLEFLPPPQRH